ncbi:MAG: ATP-dependent DNA ligase, partial [Deltaproteobacteria bacterium]|nr:ATP-dependent DNA ligase [Deltaproteobacteria bacterium]
MPLLNDLLSPEMAARLRPGALPEWIPPMKATATHRRFSDKEWIYERLLEGERCLAFKSGNRAWLFSSGGGDRTSRYGEIRRALAAQEPHDFIMDGQAVPAAGEGGVAFHAFDLLYVEGHSLLRLPLRQRKSLLLSLFRFERPLCYCPHVNERGVDFHEEACAKGWKGVMAKDARAPYLSGRSKKWIKFKCLPRQEAVVGGYTEPR